MKRLKFDDWIKHITVVIDTREKEIKHITSKFDKLGVNYMFDKLEVGDYSFIPDSYDQISNIVIERKNSLDEISQNFSKNRDRFKREFDKLGNNTTCHLVIENNTLNDIMTGNYRSDLHINSFIASLLSFEYKYGIRTHFINKIFTAELLLKIFYYHFY